MKKIFFSFGAVILLASFSNHPGNTITNTSEKLRLQIQNGKSYHAELNGSHQSRGGDPNAYGHVILELNPGQGSISYFMEVYNMDPATTARLHYGPAGVDGPVVAELHAPFTGATQGVTKVDKELAKLMHQHPEKFYVSIQNELYPDGAIRGQLSK